MAVKVSVDDARVEAFSRTFNLATGFEVTPPGRTQIHSWLRRFSIEELLDALDAVLKSVCIESEDAAFKAFSQVPRTAAFKRKPEQEQRIHYVRGILRRRLRFVDEAKALEWLKAAIHRGYSIEELQDLARTVRNWSQFRERILDLLSRY